jgi:hypothetical protein
MRPTLIFLSVLVFVGSAEAQWKSNPQDRVPVSESLVRTDGSGLLFGWFDPSQFSMRHSYSLSYSSIGGRGLSMGEYTNSMMYTISDPLSVRFDVSLMHSPFDSYGGKFGKDYSGFRISRAELNYRPSENTYLQIQFRQARPGQYLTGFGSPYMNEFGRGDITDPYRQ